MTNQKNYKEIETLKVKGTKKYQRRKIEEKEAQEEIQDYYDEEGKKIPREWLNYGGTD